MKQTLYLNLSNRGQAMPAVKPLNIISSKWTERARTSGEDYRLGVERTQKDWAGNTSQAADNYREGVTQAIAANRFEQGVSAKGTAGWKADTLAKGPQRWIQGVQLSGDKYAQGFAPYHQVISNTQLPARGPRGSAQNYERSRVMGQALNTARVQRGT